MDNIQEVDKHGASSSRATFDQQSSEDDLDSGIIINQRLFERSLSPPSELRYYGMPDPEYLVYLQKVFKEAIEAFENVPSEGPRLPSFQEIRNLNQRDHDIGEARQSYQEQLGVADIPRKQVSSSCSNLQTFKLNSFDESVDSRPEHKVNIFHESKLASEELNPYELTEEECQFVENFKITRKRLGFRQKDVVKAINDMVAECIPDSGINSFEAFRLIPQTMRKYIAVLQRWLQQNYSSYNTGNLNSSMTCSNGFPESNIKKRRVHYLSQPKAKELLEKAFQEDPMPSPNKIRRLAVTLNVRTELVTGWMKNRRKREENIAVKHVSPTAAL